jgi:tryptophan synthase alpha chain
MNRIDACFQRLRRDGKKAFVAYIVAGDPHPDRTPALAAALERAGVDILELGVPFSDPLADGIVNQLGAQRALDQGTTLERVFQIVAEIRRSSALPIIFYAYFNMIHHYGTARFLRTCADLGVDGVLPLDLPPEEAGREWAAVPEVARISLVAPTTPEDRIARIAAASTGFIYYVSREGVTGMQSGVAGGIPERVALIRKHTSIPVCVGFGVSNPDQARQVAASADGVVVGSAIVDRIAAWGTDPTLPEKLEAFVAPLASGAHAA